MTGAAKDGRWPDRLGDYDVVSTLSVGGMGAVLLATRRAHGFEKRVAIKVVLPHLIGDAHAQSLFADEARLAARFTHPNLVPTFDFGKEDDVFYLVMELVEGASFLKLLRTVRAPLSPVLAARLTADAARGLAWAHTLTDDDGRPLRVVHRDISPDNLFISRVGAVKVLDFGIANSRNRSDNTVVGMVRGKPAYMSPERARGELVDDRTDTWSLGVVFHELLRGERLFPGHGQALLDAVGKMPIPALPASVPPGLTELVDQMLRRRHGERPRMADVVARLDAFLLAEGASQTTSGLLALVEAAAPGLLAEGHQRPSGADGIMPDPGRPEGVATVDVATQPPTTSSPLPASPGPATASWSPTPTSGTDTDRVQRRRPTDATQTVRLATAPRTRTAVVVVVGLLGLGSIAAVWVAATMNGAAMTVVEATASPIPPMTPDVPVAPDVPIAPADIVASSDAGLVVDVDAGGAVPIAPPPSTPTRRRPIAKPKAVASSSATAAIVVPDRTPYVDVFVDGTKVGVSPLGSARRPYSVPAGTHMVRLVDASTGAVVLKKKVVLHEGDVVTIR